MRVCNNPGMPTYRLTLEYEGTRYHGWQEQKNARSVSGELRRAVEEAGATVRELGGSGRTDAGVHALAQAAHLRLQGAVDPEPFRREVNDRLPADIHLLSLTPAADRFHSRHDAVSRTYLYQISRRRTALAKRWVWWVKRPLDDRRMASAAALLAGRHDFRLFSEKPSEQPSTIVVVESAEVATAGALILVRLTASHFLWKMVRRVVGTLVKVGARELDRPAFEELIAAKTPKSGKGLPAEWTAPPSGLFLERVLYSGDPPLGPMMPAVPVSGEEGI
jgi:tRNA pseudouridine38-40 synthase